MFNLNNTHKIQIPRSYKDISPTRTTTLNTGEFIPFFNMEIIPNDKISLSIKSVTNMTTPNFATMDTLYQQVAFFYCPNRLVWDNWDKFYGEGKNADYEEYVEIFVPQMKCPEGGWQEKTIADYLTIPTKKKIHDVSALPFRMVAMIYNEYYRDEQRMAKALVSKGDTDQQGTNGNNYVNDLQNGGKVPKTCRLFDYFTGSKLEFQAGDPVTIPIGTTAPAYPGEEHDIKKKPIKFKRLDGSNPSQGPIFLNNGNTGDITQGSGYFNTQITPSNLYADLNQAQGITIRDFKQLLMTQQMLQNLEDGGTRYIEQLYKRWGVYANELELEIPKFLGSRTTVLNMQMIAGTGAPSGDYEFGSFTGMSNTYDSGHIFTYHFKQHGYLFGIVTIRPQNTYENGIDKALVKKSIKDYYMPEMAYFGPDQIKNFEIYSDSTDNKDDDMFGVRNYGDELRFIPNKVTGQMRTNATFSQAFKTYSINYETRPKNNQDFILSSVKQVDKTLTKDSTEMDQFVFQCCINLKMTRNLPKNANSDWLIRL